MASAWNDCKVFLKLLALIYCPVTLSITGFKYFSTKTPYEWASPVKETDLEDNLFNIQVGNLLCSAVHTSLVVRHGTRYPSQEDVHKLSEIHTKIKNEDLRTTNPDLYAWKNRFPDNNIKALSKLGQKELHTFGKRTAQRLFSLFAEEDFDSFRFITSSAERAQGSSLSFYEGFTSVLQDDADPEEYEYEPEVIDKMLRFHTMCEKYVKSVADNETAMEEVSKFQSGELVEMIRQRVLHKLGVSNDALSAGDIRTIYLSCGYEKAIFEASPWCQLLDKEDMLVLEYLGDLKHYYKNGHGHKITWQQACPLVSDIFYTMDDAIDTLKTMDDDDDRDEGYIVGQFAFGHAETVGPFYTALGLFNDSQPLRADNFPEQNNRLFRSSLILPFMSNLQFILYECEPEEQYFSPGEEHTQREPEYFLRMLINEKDMPIPGCETDPCPYRAVREMLKHQIDECHFAQICQAHIKDEL